MLEGKEVQGKIGEYGEYAVDIDDKGIVTASVSLKADLILELNKLVQKSNVELLKTGMEMLMKALGKTA